MAAPPPGGGAGGRPAEPEPPALLDVGRVVKAHGLTGEVVVDLWTDRTERLHPGATFVTARSRADGSVTAGEGELLVTSSRPHLGRFLVRFEGVVDRPGADALRGTVLRSPPTDDPGTLWVHELIGAEVTDTTGRRLGRVVAVEANPASDLLVLDGGALVPARFVVDHDPGVAVTVDVPEGLVE